MIDDDLIVPPATAVATEIHERFNKLMARGGRIDRIMNGHPDLQIERVSDEEADRILRNLETQLVEFKDERAAASEWYAGWKERQPKGFRAKRRRDANTSQESHVKHEAAE